MGFRFESAFPSVTVPILPKWDSSSRPAAADLNHRLLSRCPRESHSSLAPSRVRSRVPPVPNFRTGIPGFPALSPRLSWMSAQRQSRHAAAKCGCQGEWPMPKFARIIGESLGAEAAPGLSLPRRPLPFRSYLHRSSLCCTASGRLCRAGIGRRLWRCSSVAYSRASASVCCLPVCCLLWDC